MEDFFVAMESTIRDYPVVRGLDWESPRKKAHGVLIALRELHLMGHFNGNTQPWSSLSSGMGGAGELHSLIMEKQTRIANEMEAGIVDRLFFMRDDAAFWVRYATQLYLNSGLSKKLSKNVWIELGIKHLGPKIRQLQDATRGEDSRMDGGGLALEVERYHAGITILGECFKGVISHLASRPESILGSKEMLRVAEEVDFVTAWDRPSIHQAFYHNVVHGKSRKESFEVASTAILDRMRKWQHPVRIEFALKTMIPVLPHLGSAVFDGLRIKDLVSHMRKYWFGEIATESMDAVNKRREEEYGAASPMSEPLSQYQASFSRRSSANRSESESMSQFGREPPGHLFEPVVSVNRSIQEQVITPSPGFPSGGGSRHQTIMSSGGGQMDDDLWAAFEQELAPKQQDAVSSDLQEVSSEDIWNAMARSSSSKQSSLVSSSHQPSKRKNTTPQVSEHSSFTSGSPTPAGKPILKMRRNRTPAHIRRLQRRLEGEGGGKQSKLSAIAEEEEDAVEEVEEQIKEGESIESEEE